MINVQFSDESESEIVSYFSSAQSSDQFDNLGVVEATDDRWRRYFDKLCASGIRLDGVPPKE